MPKTKTKTRAQPQQPKSRKPEVYKLRLYVAGQTPKSIRALANLKVLCEEHLKGRYRIEVIDLLENLQMARGNQIVAVPTLVRELPQPVRHRPGVGGPGAATGRLTQIGKVRMKKPPKKSSPAGKRKPRLAGGMEQPGSPSRQSKYILRLYISGSTPKSALAVQNIKWVCKELLKGRYDLEVIDIYQQAHLARDEQIVAVPTLIKRLPLPLQRLIGDMSNLEKVLFGLDLRVRE